MGSPRFDVKGAGGLALSLIVTAAIGAQPAAARGPLTCTWAGTPDAPTGTFSISPGLTFLPSAGALKFRATGELAGGPGCHGTMAFVGQLDRGASCAFATFEGRVRGLPGVARFRGHGTDDVPSLLFDRRGDVVGVENAEIMTNANFPHTKDCATPQGFTGGWPGMFSSVVERFGAGR